MLAIARRAVAALAVLSVAIPAGAATQARPPAPVRPPAPTAPAPQSLRFLALGDSYTIGERVPAAASWPVQLAALLRARGVPMAEPQIVARTGWTVDDLAIALAEAEPSGPYELVSLQIGVNDQYRGRGAEEFRGAFRVMLGRAVALAGGQAGRVVVLSIPDWSVTPFAALRSRPELAAEIERFNAVVRQEASRAGARHVDVTPESRDAGRDPALLAADGLHPAAAMYTAWARLALPSALAALGRSEAAPNPPGR
jgi:lysophospholipase L1-like esterase